MRMDLSILCKNSQNLTTTGVKMFKRIYSGSKVHYADYSPFPYRARDWVRVWKTNLIMVPEKITPSHGIVTKYKLIDQVSERLAE
jgi:hypothetical protein